MAEVEPQDRSSYGILDAIAYGYKLVRSPMSLDSMLTPEEVNAISSRLPDSLSEDAASLLGQEHMLAEIRETIQAAYNSFFDHLDRRCGGGEVVRRYIEEVRMHVTPIDAIEYDESSSGSSSASAVGVEDVDGSVRINPEKHDPTRRNITISAGTIYYLYSYLKDLEYCQGLDDRQVVALAVKFLTYHELTHSLQAAFHNYNGRLVRMRSGSYHISGPKLGIEESPKRYSSLGLNGLDETIEVEKQAEGLAVDFLLLDEGFDPEEAYDQDKRAGFERFERGIRDNFVESSFKGLLLLSRRIRSHYKAMGGDAEMDTAMIFRALDSLFHNNRRVLDILGKSLTVVGELRGYMYPHTRATLQKRIYPVFAKVQKNETPLRVLPVT